MLQGVPTFEVICDDASGRVRRNRLSKMLLERVVGKLEALLRRVRPQVVIHAAVHRLAKLISSC